MRRNTNAGNRKLAAVIMLLLSVLLCSFSAAEAASLTDVSVTSAPMTTEAQTANGMVRVYLASLGDPTTLNLTINGSYSISSSGEFLTNGSTATVTFNSSTGAITLSANGQVWNMGKSFSLRRHTSSGASGIKIRQARESNNPYPGDLSFKAVLSTAGYKLYTIAHVYIEDYLYGVVPYEMGNSSNIEALKAQAVAARTYTVRMMKTRASGLYDVKDTTSDQSYRGTPSGNANCVAAIDATRGIVLMHGSNYITTYYSASNGGQTEISRSGTTYAYMTVKDDPFDYANPSSTVKKKTVYADLNSSLNNSQLISLLKSKAVSRLVQSGYPATSANTTLGTLQSITPHTPMYASPSRLYTKMDFTFTVTTQNNAGGYTTLTQTVTCDIFNELESRLSMSIQSASSELWSVVNNGGSFELQARRYGHGMGMSQRGAMYMAKLGYTYDQILGFYYVGCKRVKHSFTSSILSPGGDEQVTVQKPAEDQTDSSACYATVRLANAGSSLAIRSSKSTNSKIIATAANGAKLNVFTNDGTWCYIGYGELRGYVQTSALIISGAPSGSDEGATHTLGFVSVTANDYVNLRDSGSMSAKVLGTAPNGAVMTVFSQNGTWAKVQYNALAAYVNMGYISAITQSYPSGNVSSGSQTAAVTLLDGGTVNLRAEASTGAEILAQLTDGTLVTVLSDDGSWCQVSYSGMTGYIMADYLTYTDEDTFPSEPEERPEQDQTDTLRAVVTTEYGSLNMRAQAFAGSQILTTIPRNMEITVTQRGETWCGVEYGHLSGYVMTKFLTFAGEDDVPEPELPTGNTAIVVTPSGTLNLRLEPRTGSGILTQIPPGNQVTVHERGSEWCRVTWQGMTGYVMTVFLSFDQISVPETSLPEQAPSTSDYAAVTTQSGSLNLRAQPSRTAEVIAAIPRNALVEVLQHGMVWCNVRYNGMTGYVMTSYLTFGADGWGDPEEEAPAPEIPEQQTAYVVTQSGALNMRSQPGIAYSVVALIPQYAPVTVTSYGNDWCGVEYAGINGYVMTRYLHFGSPPEQEPSQPETNGPTPVWVNISSGTLNLRSEASATARILTLMPRGAQAFMYDQIGEWALVEYEGIRGYAMMRYLSIGYAPQDIYEPEEEESGYFPMKAPERPTYAEPSGTDGAVLRIECSEYGQAAGYLPYGSRAEVLLYGESWSYVRYEGIQGYCKTELLSVIEYDE